MKNQKTTLIILTRNEVDGLKTVLRTIPFEAVDEFFAVDYQSNDGTVDFFQKHNIPVFKQIRPGRAEAFRLGAKKAHGEFLIFFSPDGNEDPADIPTIAHKLTRGSDIVIASRFLPTSRNEEDGHVWKFRKWANQGFTILANLMWHGTLTDSINGYRGITKTAFNRLHLDAEGFAIEYQMSIRALKQRMMITEIPTKEGDRIGGASGSSPIPTGLQFIVLFFKELMS